MPEHILWMFVYEYDLSMNKLFTFIITFIVKAVFQH